MIRLSAATFSLPYERDPEARRALAEFALDQAKLAAEGRFFQARLELEIRAQSGSTRVRVTILTTTGIFLGALAKYGDIRTGAQLAWEDSKTVVTTIRKSLASHDGLTENQVRVQHLPTAPAQLQRLFDQVARGDLTPEEATNQALKIFEKEPDDASPLHEFAARFRREAEIRLRPEWQSPSRLEKHQPDLPEARPLTVPRPREFPRRPRDPIVIVVSEDSTGRRRVRFE